MRTLVALGWIGLVASCGGGDEPRPALLLDVAMRPVTTTTAFGEARVWVGGGASREL